LQKVLQVTAVAWRLKSQRDRCESNNGDREHVEASSTARQEEGHANLGLYGLGAASASSPFFQV